MLVLIGGFGGLGNKLYTFAHVVAACSDLGVQVANLGFAEVGSHFRGSRNDPLCRFPSRESVLGTKAPGGLGALASKLLTSLSYRVPSAVGWPERIDIGWHQPCDLTREDFIELAESKRLLILHGFLFHHPDVWGRSAAIREYFAPTEEVAERAGALVSKARAVSDVVVGVHMRRGDYRGWRDGIFYYDVPVYLELIEHVRALLPDREVSFLVTSDEDVESLLGSAPNVIVSSEGPFADLYALAACDYVIGPPSTFSGWASFYGEVPRWEFADAESRPRLEDFRIHQNLVPPLPSVALEQPWERVRPSSNVPY